MFLFCRCYSVVHVIYLPLQLFMIHYLYNNAQKLWFEADTIDKVQI